MRLTEKDLKEIAQLTQFLSPYKRIIVVTNEDIPTPQLQKLRSELRAHNASLLKARNVRQVRITHNFSLLHERQ